MKKKIAFLILTLMIFIFEFSIVHSQTWKDLMDSNNIYSTKGDFQKAIDFCFGALDLAKKQYGDIDTNVSDIYRFLTFNYWNQRKYDSALTFARMDSSIRVQTQGKINSNYASTVLNLGAQYSGLMEFELAEKSYRESLEINRKLYPGDSPDMAMSLSNMAIFYNSLGRYSEAEPLIKEALEMDRRLFIGNHESIAWALYNLAMIYQSMGKDLEAEPLLKESLEMNKKLYSSDHISIAMNLNNLSNIYINHGKLTEAEPLLVEAIGMFKRLIHGDYPDLARCMINLGKLYRDQGKLSEAEVLLKESLEMNKRLFSGDHPDIAVSLENLADLYRFNGNYSEAEPLFNEALAMAKKVFVGDHSIVAAFSNNLAGLYQEQGRLSESEPLLKEALEMIKRIHKGDHIEVAMNLETLGDLYTAQGRQVEAELLYRDAIEMQKRMHNGDRIELASSLASIGTLYFDQGRINEAYINIKDALDMYRRLFQGDNLYVLRALNILGAIYTEQLKYTESEQALKEAAEMSIRLFKDNNTGLGSIFNNLSILYQRSGRANKAEPLLIEALNMAKMINNGDNQNVALCLTNLAILYLELGKFNEAKKLNKEALEILQRLFKGDNQDISRVLNELAELYNIQDKLSDAEPFFEKSLEMYKNIYIKNSVNLSENEKNQFWSTLNKKFESFNSFACKRIIENPAITVTFYNLQLFSKGLLLNSSNKIKNRILNLGDSTLIFKFKKWIDSKEYLLTLYRMTIEELKKRNINLDSIVKEVNLKEKELSRLSEGFKQEFENKVYSWEDVKNSLRDNEASIEIVRFRSFDKTKIDSVNYAALIIRKESRFPELVQMNNGKELEARLIDIYRMQIEKQKKVAYDPEIMNFNLKELYSNFWLPIQKRLKGIKTVYLSLDGVYNQINLNTLINPKTGKYLLDEMDLRIVTSTRDLVEKKNTPLNPLSRGEVSDAPFNPPSKGDNTAELFGDPQFNLDSSKYIEVASRYVSDKKSTFEGGSRGMNIDSTLRQGISSLPGTRKEIEKIESDMKAKNWKVHTYLGAEALEDAIKAVKSPRVLHIATHGKFLKDVEIKEERSFGIETQRYVENPLLRSMLLFTGAENTINKGSASLSSTEDGLLTAYEAMNLNLDNTELVVLSACETGLGEIKNGEGVYGLQRAFQVAGAKSLIMSLWSVSDAATQELMTSFYDKWLSGKTKREAFREAQVELKKKYPRFYYWGAFVMVGE